MPQLQIGENITSNKAKFVLKNSTVPLQFNPNQYEFSEDGIYDYDSDAGAPKGVLTKQFLGIKPKTFKLSLDFDTSSIKEVSGTSRAETSVKKLTNPIEALADVKESEHMPELVAFEWGEISFKGYVTSVKTTFTLFSKEGIPLRAKVDVVMEEDPWFGKDKKALESPDRTKTRVLSEDITIWSLAESEYGDMGEWRRIARANGILNPFEVETGRILEVPAIVDEKE